MYKLAPLPYDYNDLEPYIDERTLNIHRNAHQQKYLDNLNVLLKKNNFDYRYKEEELIDHLDEFPLSDRDDILYNLGGVINHNLYFDSMSPNYQNTISDSSELGKAMIKEFGSIENFEKEFLKKANQLVGSGYTFLVVNKQGKLQLINMSNQETPYYYELYPIIAIDLWEHAYYLKHQNKKDQYLKDFFTVIDYEKANRRYVETQKELEHIA